MLTMKTLATKVSRFLKPCLVLWKYREEPGSLVTTITGLNSKNIFFHLHICLKASNLFYRDQNKFLTFLSDERFLLTVTENKLTLSRKKPNKSFPSYPLESVSPGVLSYMGYIGMSGPKWYGFSAVLVIDRVSILADFGHFGYKEGMVFALSPALIWEPLFGLN